MERLTKRNEDDTAYYYPNCFKECDGVGYSSKCDTCSLQDKVCEKLGRYEDLEEQGLLLKPKCKVGDTVYAFLPNDNHFTKAQINKIEIKPTIFGKMCYFIEPVGCRGHLYRYFENDFGKTVFLTKAEAEESLKEMEDENETD